MVHASITDNPIAKQALTFLRDKNTPTDRFRLYSDQICKILLGEVAVGLPTDTVDVETPLATTKGVHLSEHIIIVPILRAGLAMLSSATQYFPRAKVGFVGLKRDEETAIAHEYYWNVPPVTDETTVIITDPMLATGGSLLHVLKRLHEFHPREIRVVSVISAPEGIDAVQKEFPDVGIFTGVIDERLNAQKFIVPGLGDYGDRYFGTE